MCIYYRKVNGTKLPFEYPILRCKDAIKDFGDSAGKLLFISLYARSSYHQISVRECDQDKLAFFLPGNDMWTWSVMPFGPHNAPAFYTCLLHVLSPKWNPPF
jgi:hypothetical protein